MPTDEELIANYRDGGDAESLNILLGRHLSRVRRMAYMMVLHADDADDLTQEIFLRVFRGLPRFDGRARFESWLFRVSMNTAHNFLRRHRNRSGEHASVVERAAPIDSLPDRIAVCNELEEELGQALAELSPRLRAALLLTAIEGLSPQEAAQAEGCSTATIYWRIYEGRRRLKKRLRKHLP